MDKLLLHSCCAPCSVYCVDTLRADGIEPTSLWFNPNIHPWTEYDARRRTLLEYGEKEHVEVHILEDYGLRDFVRAVSADIDHRCAHCNTIRLGTLLIDESGSGMLTYSVENPDGVKYTDAGYGEAVDMSAEPSMWLDSAPDAQGYGGTCITSRCHVDEDASTDTRLPVVLYFAAGKDFQKGDDFYFTVRDSAYQPYSISIQPQTYVPVKTLTAKNGEIVTLSALGMTIVNPDPSREIHTDEVLVNAKDGSSFAVESSSKNLMNWVIGSITGDGQAAFANYTYVFNRLVDVNEVGSVTLTGYYYNLDGSDNDTVSLTYQP